MSFSLIVFGLIHHRITEKESFGITHLAFSGTALHKKAIYSVEWVSGSDKVACIPREKSKCKFDSLRKVSFVF